MSKTTFSIGERVALGGIAGYVRETSAGAANSVLVEFDRPIPGKFTRHAFVSASDLALLDDDPIEAHDTANGRLWPRTIVEICNFAGELGVKPSSVIGALQKVYEARPDYGAMEAAALGDPASKPAGGDL